MSDEPIIIPENTSIVPVEPKLPVIWQPRRALPVLGAAATLLWLGRLLVKRRAAVPVIRIPDFHPSRSTPQWRTDRITTSEPTSGRRVTFRYYAQWSVSIREDS